MMGRPGADTKRAIELALQNSKEIKWLKFKRAWRIARHKYQAQFMRIFMQVPARGIHTAYRRRRRKSASIFNVSYTEQIFNEPLRGQAKETEEQSKAQKIVLQDAKNNVITRTAMAYLELGKVRHALNSCARAGERGERFCK